MWVKGREERAWQQERNRFQNVEPSARARDCVMLFGVWMCIVYAYINKLQHTLHIDKCVKAPTDEQREWRDAQNCLLSLSQPHHGTSSKATAALCFFLRLSSLILLLPSCFILETRWECSPPHKLWIENTDIESIERNNRRWEQVKKKTSSTTATTTTITTIDDAKQSNLK